MNKVRVLLADDHQAILARVRRELGEEFEVIGTAANGAEAVDAVSQLDPDVLVIDISMPGLSGLEAAERLHTSCRRTKIVFLTIHSEEQFVQACIAEGALGYVVKGHMKAHLIPAIQAALIGESYVSPLIPR